jgi:hypothetical protein
MVNKRDIEVSIVYFSCHFDVGQFLYHWAGGTSLAFSVYMYAYNDKNLLGI